MTTTKLSAEDISRLFDIEPGPNLDTTSDYGIDSSGSQRPFEDTVEDLKAVMEPEEETIPTLVVPDEVAPKSKPEPGDVGQFEPDAYDQMIQAPEPEVTPEPEVKPEPKHVVCGTCQGEDSSSEDSKNPLGLAGYDFEAYQDLSRDHPRFCLYDGSQAFKGFYRHKVTVLKSLLSTFSIIPLADYLKELGEVCLNHQVGNATVSPELIRKKIDDVGMARVRVVEILSEALSQYPVWEKSTNMLSGKLWKDHESKGAHKRDGLNTEHMREMIMYVEKLKGFIDSAKTIDGFLKAASDGLSRQLSCIQVRQHSGISSDGVSQMDYTSRDTTLDAFDTVPEGTVISEPKNGGALTHHDFGVPATDDEFADIG